MKLKDRLTGRDKDILKAFIAWEASHVRQCPTYRDLSVTGGVPFGSVQERLDSLERKGMITRQRWIPRSLELTEQGRTYFEERP